MTSTTSRTRLALLLGTGVTALALAGCGSGGAGSGAATTVTASATTTTTAPSTPTSAAPTTTGSSGSGGSGGSGSGGSGGSGGQCAESQLRASIDTRSIPGNGTPGADGKARFAALVDFQNTSGTSCVLSGFPGAALVDDSGSQVKQAQRTLRGSLGGLPDGLDSPPAVTLAPGAYASALLEGEDQQEQGAAQAGCDAKYPSILVTPPNTTVAVPFTVQWGVCYSFEVHPVRALDSPPA